MRIAIAVQQGLTSETHKTDDWLLKSELESRGIQVDLIDWRDSSINLTQYDSILVSSTWNASTYPDEFLDWINRCELDKKRLINSAEILKLGLNKDQYLTFLLEEFGDIDSLAGSITPSLFIKPGDKNLSFSNQLTALKERDLIWANDIVIKPIISADGNNTYRLTEDPDLLKNTKIYRPLSNADRCISELLGKKGSRGVIAQPFIPSVEHNGEYQLVFIGQHFSHATVKPKGFKNNNTAARQNVSADEMPAGMLEFAARIMSFYFTHYPDEITRTRLDFFVGEKGPILCEVEVVEPNTNIRRLEPKEQALVVEKYAAVVINRTIQLNAIATIKNIFSEESVNYSSITIHPELCKAVMKIHDTHLDIMSHLSKSEEKYALAKIHSPIYLRACFDALNIVAKKDSLQPDDKKLLLHSLEEAKEQYCQSVLSKDRSAMSKAVRLMLKGVVNFIAGLSFGIAHYINYRNTGTATFFADPASESKLKQAHYELKKELEKPGSNIPKGTL